MRVLTGVQPQPQPESESLVSEEDEEEEDEEESELELLPLRRDGWLLGSTLLGFSAETKGKYKSRVERSIIYQELFTENWSMSSYQVHTPTDNGNC